ncbi:hypothetical protein L227DRAFT_649463 [Lentinus tigrinus ALCF2SS1-6]|uniref:DUF6533 domain-containing protein n=1 Tax=Lentinus tigrinus ALCF2SS1-6 TaxID=1328759 RepID=A0A5C2SNW0_9APHY|nr:hypothetical protein L227DRAFT_649463 [Lentinus tigrinus ALCF2SS1-6]
MKVFKPKTPTCSSSFRSYGYLNRRIPHLSITNTLSIFSSALHHFLGGSLNIHQRRDGRIMHGPQILEILATLPDEVTFLWPDRLSIMKVVYFVNKYSVLVDALLAVTMGLWKPHSDPEICRTQFTILAYVTLVGILFSESILIMRTMALWGYDKRVVFYLTVWFLEIFAFATFAVHETAAWTAIPSCEKLQIMGCLPTAQDNDVWPAYACLMMGETGECNPWMVYDFLTSDYLTVRVVIMLLTFLRRYLDHDFGAASRSGLIRTMYRDGLFSYIVVLALSTANLSVMLFAPEGLTPLIQIPLRVTHSALCTRVLLNLRRAAAHSTSVTANSIFLSMDGYEHVNQTTLVFRLAAISSASDDCPSEDYVYLEEVAD